METPIIHLGTRVVNNYLIPSGDGRILIDTGYAGGFAHFQKMLGKNGVRPGKIRFIPNGVDPRGLPPRRDVIREEFGLETGYSDHTQGIEVPIAAAALGAVTIEKHFTLDRNMEGPDHKASLEPEELAAMVRAIRNIEKAVGTGVKTPSPSERKNMAVARKSIVAKERIRAGETLTEGNLAAKRPGTGISPMRWNEVIGTKAVRDFEEDEQIEL